MALSKNRSMKFTSNGFTDSTPKLILQDNSTITIDSIVEQTGIYLPKTNFVTIPIRKILFPTGKISFLTGLYIFPIGLGLILT